MTELFPISQPPTESDGDANGQIFLVFSDNSKILCHVDEFTSEVSDYEPVAWARTGFNPPKRPTRIVYGEPCSISSIGPACLFADGLDILMRTWSAIDFEGCVVGRKEVIKYQATKTVTPVTFE